MRDHLVFADMAPAAALMGHRPNWVPALDKPGIAKARPRLRWQSTGNGNGRWTTTGQGRLGAPRIDLVGRRYRRNDGTTLLVTAPLQQRRWTVQEEDGRLRSFSAWTLARLEEI